MNTPTFADRCQIAEQCLPAAPYRTQIKQLHAEMLEALAAREWVGLTDAEFQWIYDYGRTPAGMMEMVEAKLKEKNT